MSRSIILAVLLIVMAYPAVSQQTTKPFRIGIAGLTHGHVHGILSRAHDGDIEIVGIAETNRELAERLLSRYKLPPQSFTLRWRKCW